MSVSRSNEDNDEYMEAGGDGIYAGLLLQDCAD
jgi:hypothetical protein